MPAPPSEDAPAVVAAINVHAMRRMAGGDIARRAANLLRQKRDLRIERVSDRSARVRVNDEASFQVEFALENGTTAAACDCPFGAIALEVVCKHKLPAAMLLREKYARALSIKPMRASDWREDLGRLLRPEIPSRIREKAKGILFFSFLQRYGKWAVQPGYLSAASLPEELWRDRAALSRFLVEHRTAPEPAYQAFPLHAGEMRMLDWVNATPASQSLLRMAFELSRTNYYYDYSQDSRASFWEALAGELVFLGRETALIEEPIEVLPGIAKVVLEMEWADDGVRLSFAADLADRSVPLSSRTLTVFENAPLWLREKGSLFRVDLTHSQFNLLRRQGEVRVPTDSLDEFYATRFGAMAERFALRGEAARAETLADIEPTPRAYLIEADGELQVSLRFGYNGFECVAARKPPASFFARDAERDVVVEVERNHEREAEWRERLGDEAFGLKPAPPRMELPPDRFLLRKKVHPYDFLKNRVPKLVEAGVEIYGEADLSARVNRARPILSFEVTSEIDWFDLKAVAHWGDQEVSLAEVRKALRRKETFIKLADGTIGEIPEDWLKKYRHLFGLSEARDDGMRVARHHVALLDQLLADSEDVKTDRRFEAARAWLKNFEGIQEKPLPEGFQGTLRPYQKAGYDWLHFLREAGFGGCLADDMGTGKTIQTLCFLQSLKEEYEARNRRKRKKEPPRVHLLVVPRSLVTNWEREAAKFAPALRVLDFAHLDRPGDTKEFDSYDVVLTTYGILLREIDRLREYEFDTVILDEAQAIKNPVSESARAARMLGSRHRLTLTGTPVENNTLELWSQFAFLSPGLLGSAEYFREEFMGPIEREKDEPTTRTLKRLVYPFILRRTKDQVALDLPPRTEKILWSEMDPAQRKLYNETRDEYRAQILKLIEDKGVRDARFRVLEGLLRLRQICNHPRLVRPAYKGGSAKMEALLETLETMRAEGHKVLVFSQFVQMLKLIEKELRRMRIAYAYLDGSTVNRQARVDRFQSDDAIRVFLISLKAGGVGLNLTAADNVIHVDPWWNPAVEMQATDRAHRIGQHKPVFVYKLMTRDSVEEKILQLQDRKRSLVQQLITTETGFFKSLTAEDIQGLFS